MSLRLRVLAVALVIAIAPVALVGLWGVLERDLAADMRTRLEFEAMETDFLLDQPSAQAKVVATDEARTHGVRVRIVDRAGVVTGDADFDRGTDTIHQLGQLFFGPDGAPTLEGFDAGLGPLSERPEVLAATAGKAMSGCRTSPGAKLLVCHAAVKHADGSVVYVQESSRRAVRALYDLRYQLLRLSVAMTPLAVIVALVLGRSIVRPIRALGDQARERAKNPREKARLDVVGDAEVRDLARAFNELLLRLDERQTQNERFTAELAHEIKNPLATVRAAADAMESGKLDGPRAERLARALRDAGGRLDGIVTQFLELARAEGGLSADERVSVDLAELARTLAEACRARHEDVELTVEAEAPALVRGVPHGLDAALRNLLENAFSFAKAGDAAKAAVRVVVRNDGDTAEVLVQDSGPGIPEAELGRVFDRFFTTRGRERGTGLGLALVKATVLAHGGTVAVTSEPGHGAAFVIRLPRA